ncbi:MAG: rhodanese-like domain-containing protein [Deltaproteobacteria bacterium]|nr:rhodanese-like domain-containing protein [Deltaproteobacteria bacterium]
MIRDALLVLIIATTIALVSNAFREDGIPLVAEEEYTILVPCPESMGEAIAINPDDPLIKDPDSLIIDVRSLKEYDEWHLSQALNQPYDWLAEQDEVDRKAAEVAKSIARSGKHHVVVYGDGGNPDSGKHWAASLSGSGIKNVVYISGGADALQRLKDSSGGKQ